MLIIAAKGVTDDSVSQEDGHCSPSDITIAFGVVCYTTLNVLITMRLNKRSCNGQEMVPLCSET